MSPIKYFIHHKSNYIRKKLDLTYKKIYQQQVNVIHANAGTDSILIYWISKELLLTHMKLDTIYVDDNKNQNFCYLFMSKAHMLNPKYKK